MTEQEKKKSSFKAFGWLFILATFSFTLGYAWYRNHQVSKDNSPVVVSSRSTGETRSQEELMQTFLTNSKALTDEEYRRLALQLDSDMLRKQARNQKRKARSRSSDSISDAERIRQWNQEVEQLAAAIKRQPRRMKQSPTNDAFDQLRRKIADPPPGAVVRDDIKQVVQRDLQIQARTKSQMDKYRKLAEQKKAAKAGK